MALRERMRYQHPSPPFQYFFGDLFCDAIHVLIWTVEASSSAVYISRYIFSQVSSNYDYILAMEFVLKLFNSIFYMVH